jgi:translation initiation factor IF-1
MNRIYGVNDKFFSEWNQDMAYTLGFITADGCVKGSNRINICIRPQDIEILRYIKKATISESPINYFTVSGTEMADLTITSEQMVEDLAKLNVTPNKTYTITAPQSVPGEFANHYLRGLFDGDGGISYWNTKTSKQLTCECTIDTASKEFAKQVSGILAKNKVNSIVYPKENKIDGRVTMHRVRMTGADVVEFGSFIYSTAKFYLTRKYRKYMEYLSSRMSVCSECNNLFYRYRIGDTKCGHCIGHS